MPIDTKTIGNSIYNKEAHTPWRMRLFGVLMEMGYMLRGAPESGGVANILHRLSQNRKTKETNKTLAITPMTYTNMQSLTTKHDIKNRKIYQCANGV